MGRTKGRESYDERILGSGRFVEALWKEEELRDRLGPQMNLLELVERVSEALGVPVRTVLRRSRNADATTARQVVCHVATRTLAALGTEVGERLGMGRSGTRRCGGRCWAKAFSLMIISVPLSLRESGIRCYINIVAHRAGA